VTVILDFDNTFLLEYLEVAVYLVVVAIDDTDEICDVSSFSFGES